MGNKWWNFMLNSLTSIHPIHHPTPCTSMHPTGRFKESPIPPHTHASLPRLLQKCLFTWSHSDPIKLSTNQGQKLWVWYNSAIIIVPIDYTYTHASQLMLSPLIKLPGTHALRSPRVSWVPSFVLEVPPASLCILTGIHLGRATPWKGNDLSQTVKGVKCKECPHLLVECLWGTLCCLST